MTARPLLLVDSASLYFRAYFGIPESSATAPDGTPVNAVRGFLDMVATLVRTRRPGRLICALDADWRPAWRVAALPSYKAHRLTADGITEVVPEGLNRQVPIIEAVLAATGIVAVGAPGYEADDVIGTLAAREPGPVEVASGDRDLFQVVDDARGVRVLYCGRGVAKLQVCDDSAIRARYGITPPILEWVTAAGFAAALPDLADQPLPLVCAALAVLHPGRPAVIAAADAAAGHVWLPAPGHALMLTPQTRHPDAGGPGTVVLPRPLGGSWTTDPPVPVVTTAQVAWACRVIAKGHVRLEAALTEPPTEPPAHADP